MLQGALVRTSSAPKSEKIFGAFKKLGVRGSIQLDLSLAGSWKPMAADVNLFFGSRNFVTFFARRVCVAFI